MRVTVRRCVSLTSNFALTFLLAIGPVGGHGALLAAAAERPALVQKNDPAAARVAQLATPPQPTPPTSNVTAPPSPPADSSQEVPQVDGEATLPRDLSPWGMFMAADHVVKAVMIGLALASVLSWTVWLAKSLELLGAKRRATNGVRALAESRSLHEAAERLRKRGGPIAAFTRAAETEIKLSVDAPEKDGIKERVGSRLERIEAAAGRRMSRGTGILATIGSTGPFVGLFGTVWGIMNSFASIAATKNTSLAVVAPGIAEALIATALGLVAAIPAVLAYNKLSGDIGRYAARLQAFAGEFGAIMSRQLEERH